MTSSNFVGWQAYRVETYVSWRGHGQEMIPVPRPDGLVAGAGGGALMAGVGPESA